MVLTDDNQRDVEARAREQAAGLGRAPAGVVGVDERVDERGEAGRDADGADGFGSCPECRADALGAAV